MLCRARTVRLNGIHTWQQPTINHIPSIRTVPRLLSRALYHVFLAQPPVYQRTVLSFDIFDTLPRYIPNLRIVLSVQVVTLATVSAPSSKQLPLPSPASDRCIRDTADTTPFHTPVQPSVKPPTEHGNTCRVPFGESRVLVAVRFFSLLFPLFFRQRRCTWRRRGGGTGLQQKKWDCDIEKWDCDSASLTHQTCKKPLPHSCHCKRFYIYADICTPRLLLVRTRTHHRLNDAFC